MDEIKLEVGGHTFYVSRKKLLTGPPSRLQTMLGDLESSGEHPHLRIDRPLHIFVSILTMYQTGSLHMSLACCPGAFMEELEYWQIGPEVLSKCCYYRLKCFLEENKTLDEFQQNIIKDQEELSTTEVLSCIQRFRKVVWSVLEIPSYKYDAKISWASKVYFAITLIMILISIVTMAGSTDESFHRNMTNCERLEYLEAIGMTDQLLKTDCDNSTIEEIYRLVEETTHLSGADELYESHDDNKREEDLYFGTDANTSTQPTLVSDFLVPKLVKRVKIPNVKVPIFAVTVLERVTTIYFTLDLLFRLLVCPSILRYFKSVINVTDCLVLVGIYAHALISYFRKEEKYIDSWVDFLAAIQFMRVFRLFRIVKNIRAGRVLAYTLWKNVKDLSIMVLFLILGVCTFSNIIYFLEDKETIANIPHGWYWALVTMTTVGYGDVTPKSGLGQLVTCLCAISGLLLFAFTVPIMANNFISLYRYASTVECMFQKYESHNDDRHVSGPNTLGTVDNYSMKKHDVQNVRSVEETKYTESTKTDI